MNYSNKSNSSLLNKSINGIIWTFIDVVLNKVLFFLATLYIARILGPATFGLIGMITVFITIGNSLVDSGMSISLVRSPEISEIDISTVFIGSLIIGIISYAIFFLSAPYISAFYSQPILTNVLRVYCLIFIITAFRCVQSALITRNLDFKKNTLIALPAVLISVLIGVILANNGWGIWSIIYMYLTQQTIIAVLLWLFSGWKIQPIFSKKVFKVHFSFGYKLTLAGLLNTTCNNLNNILIGRFYPAEQSGFYERAYSLNLYPSTVFTAIISKVFMPVLSKIQNNKEQVVNILSILIKYSFLIITFIMSFMILFAKEIIYLILGEEWIGATPYLQIISLASVFLPIHMFNLNILQIYGKSDMFLKAEVIKKVLQVTFIILLFRWKVLGLSSSLIFLSISELFVNSYFVNKQIHFSIIQQFKHFREPLILFILILVLSFFFQAFTEKGIFQYSIIVLTIIVFYSIYVFLFNKKDIYRIKIILNK